jgi:hypothetical protein
MAAAGNYHVALSRTRLARLASPSSFPSAVSERRQVYGSKKKGTLLGADGASHVSEDRHYKYIDPGNPDKSLDALDVPMLENDLEKTLHRFQMHVSRVLLQRLTPGTMVALHLVCLSV